MLRRNQRREKYFFLFKPVSMAAQVRSRSGPLIQADVEVKLFTTTSEQAAAREEFARPSKRQQRRVTASGVDQTKQFDPGG